MRSLELKIPPPLVVLATALLMWLVSWAAPELDFVLPGHHLAAIVIVAAGVATAVSGAVTFRLARTTLNPTKPESSSALVSWGVYKITRNPMYLGLLLVLTAWAIFLSNALGFVFLPAFMLYTNRFQIAPEERALTSLFGQEFAAYRSRVRRWL